MKVEIDPAAGFCGGVKRAIKKAEEFSTGDGKLFSLGELVHNEREVERLKQKGVEVISCENFKDYRGAKILIRAHGEPPETYDLAAVNNIEIVDATCPVVKKLQQKISEVARMINDTGGTIVIFGKEGHAEVRGLKGHAGDKVQVVGSEVEPGDIDAELPIYLFSQTTMSREGFEELARGLQRLHGWGNVVITDSICGQVYGRAPHLKDFAGSHDVIIFISGRKSSNGQYLYGICKESNSNTYFVASPGEIDPAWVQGIDSVGISGAASTPVEDLEYAARRIESF
jgi:4-hydroxy-3-methylbut-2-enyl diphosphate reductase